MARLKTRVANHGFYVLALIWALFLWLPLTSAQAEKRHPDPDGCLSCHGLPDLKYIDQEGQIRSASILKADYYGSLHGSVPCKDCHRNISDYPHEEKDGLVDCSESCHVKEPSEGKAFTHKPVIDEFKTSVHGKAWFKDFAAGNRSKENSESSLPSCRRCHANVPYIAPNQMAKFKEAFDHNDAECGTCHEGDVWRNQFSGHILRRYLGSFVNKTESNQMCIDCHGNVDRMKKVEHLDPKTQQKQPMSATFVHSVETYDKTLHARLLKDGVVKGASCVDCHAPTGLHHGILSDKNAAASTNPAHLDQTCGQTGCHKGYSQNVANMGFLKTDMHDTATISLGFEERLNELRQQQLTPWHIAALIFGSMALIFGIGLAFWQLFGDRSKLGKNTNNAILGAEKFQTIVIGSKAKTKESHWHKLRRHAIRLFGNKHQAPHQAVPEARTLHKKAAATKIADAPVTASPKPEETDVKTEDKD